MSGNNESFQTVIVVSIGPSMPYPTSGRRGHGFCNAVSSKKKWHQIQTTTAQQYWQRTVPLFTSLQSYNCHQFRHDVLAGLTVAVMAIPLGISYATSLAGLPAVYGLYGCFIPAMVYPIFGTTPQLAVGPAALLSLLVKEGIESFIAQHYPELKDNNHQTSAEYLDVATALAIKCTFMVAILHLGMGLLRLGFFTQFLSRAVISGFLSGASIVITFSQLRHILGLSFDVPNQIHVIMNELIRHSDDWQWRPLLLGGSCIVILVTTKNLAQNETIRTQFPPIKWICAMSPIAVSILGIVLVYTLELDKNQKLTVVGTIQAGLPNISVADWSVENELWPVVISMVIVGFVQSIAISKRIGYRRGYEVDPSQELIALGMANLVGGVFSAYPTSGAIGQTVVNDEIGTVLLLLLKNPRCDRRAFAVPSTTRYEHC